MDGDYVDRWCNLSIHCIRSTDRQEHLMVAAWGYVSVLFLGILVILI